MLATARKPTALNVAKGGEELKPWTKQHNYRSNIARKKTTPDQMEDFN